MKDDIIVLPEIITKKTNSVIWPWAVNISNESLSIGHYPRSVKPIVLVQINDSSALPDLSAISNDFAIIYQLEVNAAVAEDDSSAFTEYKASDIAEIIKFAKSNNYSIVTACPDGIGRSGAIVQAAVDYGFSQTDIYKDPNSLMYRMIKKELIDET